MRRNPFPAALRSCLSLVLVCCGQAEVFPALQGPYLGQEPPGETPMPFLHDLLCADAPLHGPPVFSKDGSEVYWTPMNDSFSGILFMSQTDGQWSQPERMSFPFGVFDPGEPHISPDGNRLYFTARRFFSGEMILYADRVGDGWSKPLWVGDAVNELDLHWQVSVNDDLDLYFQVRNDDLSDGMIFSSEYVDGVYQTPQMLGSNINTDAWENFPFIAADDSYLIFARTTPDGGDDLMISFRDAAGDWGEPINMEAINSPNHDMYPVVTHDGEYIFFLRPGNGGSCPYWVSANIIEEIRGR